MRAGRATRARNVARPRVPASAWWRSSRTSRIGWRSPARSSRPWIASPIQALRRSGAIDSRRACRISLASRGATAGRSRAMGSAPDPTAARSSASSSDVEPRREALDDRSVRGAAAGRHGGAPDRPGTAAAAGRRAGPPRSTSRLTPTPPRPDTRSRGLRPSTAASSATARWDSSRSLPTNRSLLNLAGMRPSCHTGTALRRTATLPRR